MKFLGIIFLSLFLWGPARVWAQEVEDEGIYWGGLYFRPEASVLEAYDNRVQIDPVSLAAASDFYTEVAAGVLMDNLSARYDLSADARYGYRIYSEYTDLNDEFYSAGLSVSSDQNPFKWGVSGHLVKTLDYSVYDDSYLNQDPDSILTDGPSRRTVLNGDLAYEKKLSEKTSVMPGYTLQHYFREFQDLSTAEWQTHNARVELRHVYSEKTLLTLGGYYGLQVNDEEEGYIGTVEVGVESRLSDKTFWRASVGVSAADYELSGSDQAGIFNVRVVWQTTEKVSAYIFGGNEFQPGYDGGAARLVYRIGYGADWKFSRRWVWGGQVLHDYQESLGSGTPSPAAGEVRNFASTQCTYGITKHLEIVCRASYVDDEIEPNQTVLSLGLGYQY